jgi:hypothetical protein
MEQAEVLELREFQELLEQVELLELRERVV